MGDDPSRDGDEQKEEICSHEDAHADLFNDIFGSVEGQEVVVEESDNGKPSENSEIARPVEVEKSEDKRGNESDDVNPLNISEVSTIKPEFDQTPKKILIIEDDPCIHKVIYDPIQDHFPYVSVKACASGTEGWNLSQKEHFDLILTDWKLGAEVSGLALINRFREDSYYKHIPIIIISGYLNREDCSIMKEFNFTGQLLKPFKAQELISKVKDIYSEARWFSQQQETVVKFLKKALEKLNEADLYEMISDFLENCPRPVPTLLLCSQNLRKQGRNDLALKFALTAEKTDSDDLATMCELGKIYLSVGNFKKAQSYLEKSLEHSPGSLERLCDLGRISLENIDTGNAKKCFEKAIAIDSNYEKANQGIAITNKLDDFFQHNKLTSIPNSFAGLLNAVGVCYMREGDLETAVDYYEAALQYIQENTLKAYVCFNIGLGYLRYAHNQQAEKWLAEAIKLQPDYEKGLHYLEKARKALEKQKMSKAS